ncbi:hypothetical protein EQG49_07765 [Periweissella cryptocerci]|uniref:Uncharacterized protein n=1 Tax=Periweissella cryptocerci TaxID=2506420 RepID=A0A4V1AIQ9_9LACO|nr:hypothetical protein [Periweissella cryptocerci]QBO36365.1 hypothetical protein EQG49_07765 [Periweissella cryptocerci]
MKKVWMLVMVIVALSTPVVGAAASTTVVPVARTAKLARPHFNYVGNKLTIWGNAKNIKHLTITVGNKQYQVEPKQNKYRTTFKLTGFPNVVFKWHGKAGTGTASYSEKHYTSKKPVVQQATGVNPVAFTEPGASVYSGVFLTDGTISATAGAKVILYKNKQKIGSYQLGKKAKHLSFSLMTKAMLQDNQYHVVVKAKHRKASHSVYLTRVNTTDGGMAIA